MIVLNLMGHKCLQELCELPLVLPIVNRLRGIFDILNQHFRRTSIFQPCGKWHPVFLPFAIFRLPTQYNTGIARFPESLQKFLQVQIVEVDHILQPLLELRRSGKCRLPHKKHLQQVSLAHSGGKLAIFTRMLLHPRFYIYITPFESRIILIGIHILFVLWLQSSCNPIAKSQSLDTNPIKYAAIFHVLASHSRIYEEIATIFAHSVIR